LNAERLHAIALAIRDDFKATEAVGRLGALQEALQNQVNSPGQAQFEQQLSSTLSDLTSRLSQAPSNQFPPTWRQTLDEMGATPLMGRELLAAVRGIFERNQITPSVALQEVTEIHGRVTAFQGSIENLLAAFGGLNIGDERLEPGEAELGMLIPRDAVRNRLDDFAKELNVLNRTLGPFAELATGSRPGFAIRTVSSSELSVFLDMVPKVAAYLAVAIERTLSFYKQLLEIRRLRSEMAAQGVPNLDSVDEYAESVMKDGIEQIVEELLAEHDRQDQARFNELRTDLTMALNQIANRIDRGFKIEVRAAPLPPAEEGAPEEDVELRKAIATIQQSSPGLQFLHPTGKPILSLSEPEPEPEEEAEPGAGEQ
jgi:hypothetical protein